MKGRPVVFIPYDDLRAYLRNWYNPCNEIGQYDHGGAMQLMLEILDNLRKNAVDIDLQSLRHRMSDEQAEFFLWLAEYVRNPSPD
ncbi:MAG TPA: hypothetical protein VKE74_22090 [Gemmataceae bacterium]|nr:hypothetical protein [Gemmataceae bacterium]